MDTPEKWDLDQDFPNLKKGNFAKRSNATDRYNCIAFAVGNKKQRMWPADYHHWPPSITRTETIESFIELFEYLGYRECDNGDFKPGCNKVALYAHNKKPKHAAIQLSTQNGAWKSKIGENIDIEHRLKDIEGPLYGKVVMYLKKTVRRTSGRIKKKK